MLASSGVNLDVPNFDGHTPVFAAVTHGKINCLRALAVMGAKLSRRDYAAGNTPAMVAASHGQTACLCYLAERAGSQLLSDRNNDGLSSACFAVLCGREEALKAIAKYDTSLFLDPDPKGRSCPHYAAAEGALNCLRIMASACTAATAAEESAHGASAKMAAWWKGDRQRKQECPFTACLDNQGDSPLHVAARAGHLDAFEFLVSEAGLRPDDSNARGETCLLLAAANGRVRFV